MKLTNLAIFLGICAGMMWGGISIGWFAVNLGIRFRISPDYGVGLYMVGTMLSLVLVLYVSRREKRKKGTTGTI